MTIVLFDNRKKYIYNGNYNLNSYIPVKLCNVNR